MKWKVKIITHTHWDREWYLNSPYTNEWLIPFFNSLFTLLEREANYQFVLDGQMNMVDDYFDELRKNGLSVYPYKELIRKYSNEKRLFIGPYYLQPDWQLVSDEALVRNIVIGSRMAQELGTRMNVGWMLDNFGQISQTSQLHHEAGLNGIYVWRGVEMDPENVKSEFIWESPDGTRLLSTYLLNSYRNVMRLAEYSDIMKARIDGEVEKLKTFSSTSNILMMNGYDQEIVPDDIQPYIRSGELNSEDIIVEQSNPEDYMDSIRKENPKLITLKGALYSGRFISVFPGVMSARMYLKQQNDAAQKMIERYAEPLSFFHTRFGGNYNQVLLNNAWKLLLKNHPHDSICGVSIDDVHSDMERRTEQFYATLLPEVEATIKQIGSYIDTSQLGNCNYFAYSPSAYEREDVITIEGNNYKVTSKGLGYTYIDVAQITKKEVILNGSTMGNDLIQVVVLENGGFDLYDKENNCWYKGMGILEDSGDAGDEYNYSYPTHDEYFYSKDAKVKITNEYVSDLKASITIQFDMLLPIELEADRQKRKKETMKMPVETTFTIEAGSKVVGVKTTILNTVKDHIIKVLFPTDIQATRTFAGSPFDVVERPIHIDDYDESDIPAEVRKVIVGAREAKPNTIFLGKDFVDITDGTVGLAVLNKGLPEYTVYKERNTIALTLFRGVNWVANEINTRIGDAGPLIYTPEAECLREMVFEYGVYPHRNNYEQGKVVTVSDKFNHPLMPFVTNAHKGHLPLSTQMVTLDDPSGCIKITAIKQSDVNHKLVVRLFNASTDTKRVSLDFHHQLQKVESVNFMEEVKEELDSNNSKLVLLVAGKKIITLLVELSKSADLEINPEAKTDLYETIVKRNIFPEYEMMPLVTKEDVTSETKRHASIEERKDDPLWRRTVLEAKLSYILTQKRLDEMNTRRIGLKLNEARVTRRVHDYIQDVLKQNK